MKIIQLDRKSIDQEHICCAISDKNCAMGVDLKKEWMKQRFQEGLVFKRLDVRGKVFIEYIPAEYAFRPIEAPGYLFIHCLWVSGQFQGNGWANELMHHCEKDAKDTLGIAVVSSKKRVPFLTDREFFLHQGFEVCDTAPPYFELLAKKNNPKAPQPKFCKAAKKGTEDSIKKGLVFYYTLQCPFTSYWASTLSEVARKKKIPVQVIQLKNRKDVIKCPSAYATFSIFYNGRFLTHRILNITQFEKLLEQNGIQ